MMVQLYGTRRSGNHILQELLTHTLNVGVRGGGWHGVPPREPTAEGMVFISKDPYAWLESQTRWLQVEPNPRLDHALLELYLAKNAHYLHAMRAWRVPSAHVQFDHILLDPLQVARVLATAFDQPTPTSVRLPKGRVSVDRGQGQSNRFDPAPHLNREYLKALGGRVTNIRHLLEREWCQPILKGLGYGVQPPGRVKT